MIEKDENKSVLSYVIGNGLPIFLLLFNILWLISLNVTYFDDINKGLVSKDFYEYSMLNNILIFVQILVSLEVILSKAFNYSAVDKLGWRCNWCKGRYRTKKYGNYDYVIYFYYYKFRSFWYSTSNP